MLGKRSSFVSCFLAGLLLAMPVIAQVGVESPVIQTKDWEMEVWPNLIGTDTVDINLPTSLDPDALTEIILEFSWEYDDPDDDAVPIDAILTVEIDGTALITIDLEVDAPGTITTTPIQSGLSDAPDEFDIQVVDSRNPLQPIVDIKGSTKITARIVNEGM